MQKITIDGITMTFQTDPALFSPHGLDEGTRAMLSCVRFAPNDKVLDLGCGYGVVGIYAAKQIGARRVTMADIDETAVAAAKENACRNSVPDIQILQSNGFQTIADAGYTVILSNPPYHADFSVARHFIEKGFNRLVIGGRLIMVTKRREWYKNKLISIFGGVSIREINGYYVFIAEKRSASYAKKGKKRNQAQQTTGGTG